MYALRLSWPLGQAAALEHPDPGRSTGPMRRPAKPASDGFVRNAELDGPKGHEAHGPALVRLPGVRLENK